MRSPGDTDGVIMCGRKGELAAQSPLQLLQCLNRSQQRRCLICLCGLAATPDVRISATAQRTLETWRPRTTTVGDAMIHSASTTRLVGERCGRSCWSAIWYARSAARKPARKLTTSCRLATAARCGRSTTYKGCVAAVIRERHGARTAPEGMPVILPIVAARPLRSRLACEKPQVLNFFPELTHAD